MSSRNSVGRSRNLGNERVDMAGNGVCTLGLGHGRWRVVHGKAITSRRCVQGREGVSEHLFVKDTSSLAAVLAGLPYRYRAVVHMTTGPEDSTLASGYLAIHEQYAR